MGLKKQYPNSLVPNHAFKGVGAGTYGVDNHAARYDDSRFLGLPVAGIAEMETDIEDLETAVAEIRALPGVFGLDLGAPALAASARISVLAAMANHAVTIANHTSADSLGRNVTVTHVTVATTDTLGIVTVVGLDVAGSAVTEVITPLADQTVAGHELFASVTSATISTWSLGGATADNLSVGFGTVVGLPVTNAAAWQAAIQANPAGVVMTLLGAVSTPVVLTHGIHIADVGFDLSALTYNSTKHAIVVLIAAAP